MFVNLKPPSQDQRGNAWYVVPQSIQYKKSFMKICPTDLNNFCLVVCLLTAKAKKRAVFAG